MKYRLVEPCCGSAALSLYLLGAKRGITPYHGNKWRLREKLEAILIEHQLDELTHLVLSDMGPWGRTWPVLFDQELLRIVISRLRVYADLDQREVYDQLHKAIVPAVWSPDAYAAQHLFLERLAFSGKAVGIRENRWNSPGFNKSSANGTPGTPRFKTVYPMVPSLIRVLESYFTLLNRQVSIDCQQVDARELSWPKDGLHTVVYIDPNYAKSTGYPNAALPRPDVVDLAVRHHAAGCTVLVSEAEPIAELIEQGWAATLISKSRNHDGSPFKAKKTEWVTHRGLAA